MRPPRITIVTPSFNQAQFLEQTLDSVLSQNYPNLEYIVIDGGSTDASPQILQKYAKHLAYWVSEKDHGQSHALNKAFARSTGTLHAYLNSDDYYAPDALHIAADTLANHKSAWLCGGLRFFDQNGFQRIDSYDGDPPPGHPPEAAFNWFSTYRISQPATFWTADLTASCGPFNESLRYVFDWEFFTKIRFHQNLPAIPVPHLLAHFRLHDASKTISAADLFEVEIDRIFDSVLRPLPPAQQRLARQRRAYAKADRLQVSSLAHSKNHARLPALRTLLQSVKIYPPLMFQKRTLSCLRRAAAII